ncbi:MAG: hypothetical protein IAI50_19250 [Candidatus Eremiobacteraeota bacterium]|nr:hypothetical protein [Candidatus Eremiobacteraeota bacterium]
MATPAEIARFAGRLAMLGAVAGIVAIVGMQFEGIVVRDLTLAHDLAASRADNETIRATPSAQRETIRRLGDPRGAIPEIHEKLRLVGPHEEIFYVRSPHPSPQPGDGNDGP